jgi:beta-phosphoglucomutase-like phosphatase (HAD superfamily)
MVKKRLFHFFITVLCALSISIISMEHDIPYTPENTKFAFDFHDVVVTAHPYRIFNGLFTWDILPEFSWDTARCAYNLPWVAYKAIMLAYNKEAGERFYDLFKQNGFDRLALAVKRISNDVDLIEGTVAIIKELKDKGYQVDMASDIGTSFLSDLESNPKFADTLSLFTYKKSVNYLQTINPIHKPNKKFFIDYNMRYNPSHMHIIFIDDKQKNVTASKETGMIGIQFQDPAQLRAELVKRGILEDKKDH